MKITADCGLWAVSPVVAPTPVVAVVEVSGAVLSWTVDDPSGDVALTFTDVTRADWLWRVVGSAAHVSLVAALTGLAPGEGQDVELSDVDLVPGSFDALRRLAVGHWMRRWWPASARDAIAGLDPALLDAEIALLTSAAQDFFADDTLDSEVGWLLAPHAAALAAHVAGGDPRVLELVRAAVELAGEAGVNGTGWPELAAAVDGSGEFTAVGTAHSDDYALAAGPGGRASAAGAIANGFGSIRWAGVPPGLFDAAEDTIDWRITASAATAVANVLVASLGPSTAGVAVRMQSGTVSGTGVLGADGRASFPLHDAPRRPMTESAAWNHDWSATQVTVGAEVAETAETRERIRRFARSRLSGPPADAFLAEILAAESDY